MNIPFFHRNLDEVSLHLNYTEDASDSTSWVKDVHFSICKKHTNQKVGECDLRLGMNAEIYYAGQVGYRIYYPFRGNSYAYKACLQLFEVAKKEYGMKELIITCSPDNIPSLCTLQRLHGTLLETVDVPESHWLYQRGETVKCIYQYEL